MRFILLSTFIFLTACGAIQDRSSEYAEAVAGQSLVIPEKYSDFKINSRYPIPQVTNKRLLSDSFELPKPPNATAALNVEPFLIESVEGQTWLRLYTSPGKVWPFLDFFWSEYGVQVKNENISQGFVVTNTMTGSLSATEKDASDQPTSLATALSNSSGQVFDINGMAFQAKLSQGLRRNTAELQIRVLQGLDERSNEWTRDISHPELAEAMLKLIGEFITSDELENRYSLLANEIGGEPKVHILKDKDSSRYLKLNLSFQRAWNELGKALESAGVIVSDLDVSAQQYYISYLSEDELDSWYRTAESKSEMREERNFVLTLEAKTDSIEPSASSSSYIEVRIEALHESLDAETANELLDLLYEHIS
jgi:uncharacterized lipoprotein